MAPYRDRRTSPDPLERIEAKQDLMVEWLEGDGTDENPGAKIRMDRIEQDLAARRKAEDRRSQWLMTIFCGVGVMMVGGVGTAIWFLFTISQHLEGAK